MSASRYDVSFNALWRTNLYALCVAWRGVNGKQVEKFDELVRNGHRVDAIQRYGGYVTHAEQYKNVSEYLEGLLADETNTTEDVVRILTYTLDSWVKEAVRSTSADYRAIQTSVR